MDSFFCVFGNFAIFPAQKGQLPQINSVGHTKYCLSVVHLQYSTLLGQHIDVTLDIKNKIIRPLDVQ